MIHLKDLGAVPVFVVNTTNVDTSVAYYSLLGFTELMRADWPFRWVLISDGAVQIMLRQGEVPYLSLTYFGGDLYSFVHELEAGGVVFTGKPDARSPLQRYHLVTPEGVNLTYITGMEGFTRPPKPTMLQFPQGDYMKPETYPNTTVGLFGEFAVPVTNLAAALAYWKQLGFEAATTFSSPYPWAIVTDGLHIVGLHQTNMFVQPALTFFAADMQLKIATLREAGVTGFLDEGLKNTKLSTPEGQHLNLYHLGM